MGAGQTVTAFFEVVPAGVEIQLAGVDPLKYQAPIQMSPQADGDEMLSLKFRYKEPSGNLSRAFETSARDRGTEFANASQDFRFAAAVASFGMLLRDSPYKGQSALDDVLAMARVSRGQDLEGYRDSFVKLVERTREMNEANGGLGR